MRATLAALAMALTVTGCAPPVPVPSAPQGAPVAPATVPVRSFGPARPLPPSRANAEMAVDFLDLAFELESGQSLPVFTRFETPLTVAVTGTMPPAAERELDLLLGRLRREAGLDIGKTADPARAAITVEGIRFDDLQRTLPDAACFVLPTRVSFAEFRNGVRVEEYSWTDKTRRTQATVFVPVDTSQQEVRDCLHEEIAQALGPLNDLFRLGDSVFNDDNLQTVLTGFDMLMLRATYHPGLQSGLSRAEVEARLPAILAGLNPAGERVRAQPIRRSTRAWVNNITRALGPGSLGARRNAAQQALRAAQAEGWDDVRTGLSYFTLGRLTMNRDGDAALEALLAAAEIYRRREDTAIQAAHVSFHIAAFALGAGQWDVAFALTERYAEVARAAQDAALLSDLLLAQAAALRGQGRDAMAVEADGIAWGVYALGSEDRARARAAEIARLAARSAS